MMIPLGHIAVVSTGYPFRAKVESEEGGDLVLLQIKDLDVVEGVSGTGVIMLRNVDNRYEPYLLRDGDLLFQSRGSRHPVALVKPGIRGIAASGLHTIRPDRKRVLPEYLAWWLNHPNSQAKIKEDLARGSYIPFVSKSDLAGFLVAAAPLETQRRIIEISHLQQQERRLSADIARLTQELVDGVTWAAVAAKHSRHKE